MNPLRVILVDANYINDYTRSTLYVPLNIGYVASYAQSLFHRDIDISLHKEQRSLLSHAREIRPHVVGLSTYFWNTDLNRALVSRLRAELGHDTAIVLGGPSIDIIPEEQRDLMARLPGVDALVPLEGEQGLANLLGRMLSDPSRVWQSPIDGVTFMVGDEVVAGKPTGTDLDLSLLPSPYTQEWFKPFAQPPFRPLIQTARGCPYTCMFCVSGKNKLKLRTFPLDQVKEEIEFVASKYEACKHIPLFIADENFGLFDRDVEVAEFLKRTSRNLGYPRSIFFYNDKKFTTNSQRILELIGDMNQIGMALALQSENPETEKAIRRKNLSAEKIAEAIDWAAARNMQTTTELIFGLPYETKTSFCDQLDKAVSRGFDTILCHNLFLMDGIPLNRREERSRFGLSTRYRLQGPNYDEVEGLFSVEAEEVVTGSSSFDFRDYLAVRSLNFMFYTVYALRFFRWVFNAARSLGFPLVRVFEGFMFPDDSLEVSPLHRIFTDQLNDAFQGELYQTKDQLISSVRKQFEDNCNKPVAPTRLNVFFGARLMYLERSWVADSLEKVLRHVARDLRIEYPESIMGPLLELGAKERFDPRSMSSPEPVSVNCDFIAWSKAKFREPLESFQLDKPLRIGFGLDSDVTDQLRSYNRDFGSMADDGYYYNLLESIVPRSRLLFDLEYIR